MSFAIVLAKTIFGLSNYGQNRSHACQNDDEDCSHDSLEVLLVADHQETAVALLDQLVENFVKIMVIILILADDSCNHLSLIFYSKSTNGHSLLVGN